jgi:hypothetical protein
VSIQKILDDNCTDKFGTLPYINTQSIARQIKSEFIARVNSCKELDHEYRDIDGYLISKQELTRRIAEI